MNTKETPGKVHYLVADSIVLVSPLGHTQKLNRNEWKTLLKFAFKNPGSVLSENDFVGTIPLRSLAVMMNNLRSKLGETSIISVRGRGYKLNSQRVILKPIWSKSQME